MSSSESSHNGLDDTAEELSLESMIKLRAPDDMHLKIQAVDEVIEGITRKLKKAAENDGDLSPISRNNRPSRFLSPGICGYEEALKMARSLKARLTKSTRKDS